MRVGHGSARIAVDEGEPLGGYLDREQGASGTLDGLESHAISFHDGDERFILVVLDLVCVNSDVVDAVRRRISDVVAADVWVAATHTHSGVDAGCVPGGSVTAERVISRVSESAHSATVAAIAAEGDVDLHGSRSWCRGIAAHRNVQRERAADLPVDVVAFTRAGDDRIVGTLIVSPIHPTVLPAENLLVSADLTGAVRRAASERFGGWAVCATGAAGDVSTRTTRRARSAAELTRLGRSLVEQLRIDTSRPAPGVGIVHATASADLAPNVHPTPQRAHVTFGSDVAARRRSTTYEQGLRVVAGIGGHRTDPLRVGVEAVALGDIVLVSVPGEPFLGVGEQIRERSATAAIVIGCTNGYLGYFPDSDAPSSYETIVSPIDPAAIGELIAAAQEAVKAVTRRKAYE